MTWSQLSASRGSEMTITRHTDLPETTWANDALCAALPRDMFLTAGGMAAEARAVCTHCAVATLCLAWAVGDEIDDEEIWGGRTPAERRRLGGRVDIHNPPPSPTAEVPQAPPTPQQQPRPARRQRTTTSSSRLENHVAAENVASQHSQGGAQGPAATQAAPSPARCGTEAGYRRHLRNGEKACPACLDALKQVRRDRENRRAAGAITARPAIAPCGTVSAYRRHLRRGEQPDEACAAASAAYMRGHRRATTSLIAYDEGWVFERVVSQPLNMGRQRMSSAVNDGSRTPAGRVASNE